MKSTLSAKGGSGRICEDSSNLKISGCLSRGYRDNGNGFYTNDNPFSDTVWVDKDGRISHSM